jgi:glycosyltransferase involved in cell wall biosynthesis
VNAETTGSSALPLVSFVMPVFNRAKVIERALDGIIRERRENYPNLEIVVIDGGSTDGTVDILKRYGKEIDYWISERDSGVPEAFNKGVKSARGAIIRYIASDDGIRNGFTRTMMEYLVTHPDVAIAGALANYYWVGLDGQSHVDSNMPAYSAGRLDFKQTLLWTKGERFSLIESWFMRRSVFDKVGYLDTRYRICPDYDFALRVVKAGLVFEVLSHRIVDKCFYSDGSNAVSDEKKLLKEGREVIRRHAGRTARGWILLYNTPRPLHQRIAAGIVKAFFSVWLAVVMAWKKTSPGSYAFFQRILKTRNSCNLK